jgi:hypothetical protein
MRTGKEKLSLLENIDIDMCHTCCQIVKRCLDIPLYFQLPYLPEETYFQQAGCSAVGSTSQAVLRRSSDQRKVPASLSLFLKSEKVPSYALL